MIAHYLQAESEGDTNIIASSQIFVTLIFDLKLICGLRCLQVFVCEVVDWLWQSTRCAEENVACAAFEALASFSGALFSTRHLSSAIPDAAAANTVNEQVDGGADDSGIPGFLYTKLLHSIPSSAFTGLVVGHFNELSRFCI